MAISVFELLSIGIGPSSSHTVGVMRATQKALSCVTPQLSPKISRIKIELFGSLALTGKGHATDFAAVMGLENNAPESIDPIVAQQRFAEIKNKQELNFDGRSIEFIYERDVVFNRKQFLDFHANALTVSFYTGDKVAKAKTFYSIGGGFILDDDHKNHSELSETAKAVKYPFESAQELLDLCSKHNLTIADLMRANEAAWHSEAEIKEGLLQIWQVMDNSISAGIKHTGVLPGGLNLKRRAPVIYQKLAAQQDNDNEMDWLNLYAIAVNEENAAGGRVVTAPTNGAAGIIPSVLKQYLKTSRNVEQDVCDFLLTAAAIGILYKKGASISAAEVGCQGEVGVASSMAAGALAFVKGGTLLQIENAAEIAMEHHLGLTCDPIKGLVQIPCIERNAIGAVQAVTSARLALFGDGSHYVSLDKVIATMLRTGRDMQSSYKETSLGGLAVDPSLPEC